ncbi:hypothetical protein ACHWQZ_G018651 [Mnemiopsis leidyi]
METSVSGFTEKLDIRTILLVIYTIFIFFLLFLGYFSLKHLINPVSLRRFKSVSIACCSVGGSGAADRVNNENLLIGIAEKQYSAVEAQKNELMGKNQAQYS